MKTITCLTLPTFVLACAASAQTEKAFHLEDRDGTLYIKSGSADLLGYRHQIMDTPPGVDPVFERSGFIHPLNTPKGHLLTNIQPTDHYHHYGIWNPWTHTEFEGRIVDFWNLAKKEGTVRFAGFENKESGDGFAEFTAKHEHVVFLPDGGERIALNELQTVRVSESSLPNSYLVDFVSELTCGTDSPITFLEYRYGGFGWRATDEWNAENSVVLTSEGHDRNGSDGSLARWILVQGELNDDRGGMLLMSHPDNYNHPEPLRVWPESSHEGQLFVNFSPTKNKDWKLEPGKTYTLRYRMLVFDGSVEKDKADAAWQEFSETE